MQIIPVTLKHEGKTMTFGIEQDSVGAFLDMLNDGKTLIYGVEVKGAFKALDLTKREDS